MSEEKVKVSLEELDTEADGTAECQLKTENISITLKGKQELVCKAIAALFEALGMEFVGSMTEEEMRELLTKMDEVAAQVKDDGRTMYHLNITPPPDASPSN